MRKAPFQSLGRERGGELLVIWKGERYGGEGWMGGWCWDRTI